MSRPDQAPECCPWPALKSRPCGSYVKDLTASFATVLPKEPRRPFTGQDEQTANDAGGAGDEDAHEGSGSRRVVL